MKRVGLTLLIVVLMNLLVGCGAVDSGKSQLLPKTAVAAPKLAAAGETDIIEQLVANRRAYRQELEQLVRHYVDAGNNMKLNWAQKELAGLDAIRQYNYIIEASVAGPDLKATTEVPEAGYLYTEALGTEKKARELVVIVDENLLRVALDKYNKLIKKHPSSTRIADAAFRAAGIYEHFRDYSLAVLYYKRVYQWKPDTAHPAMFRAAFILDKKLHRRQEALEMYQNAMKATGTDKHQTWREYTQKRIDKLTGAEQKGK